MQNAPNTAPHAGWKIMASAIATALVVLVAPWLHDLAASGSDGTTALYTAALSLLAIGLTSAFQVLARRIPWRSQPEHMPSQQVVEEIREASGYLDLLQQQLSGTLQDTEREVAALIGTVDAIHGVSEQQLTRIRTSEVNSAELAEVVKEKIQVDQQLGSILEMFVIKQEEDVQSNLERLNRLREVKSLAPLVEVIFNVARQTNFLAINAAIEAAHAGSSGTGFAVLAAEIRQLSTRTAEAATSIGERITAATQGIDEELERAGQINERTSSTGNMRRVLNDINEMQARFSVAAASSNLLGVIEGVKSGHQDIVAGLSDVLGQLQFHDVMRQRVEQVQSSLLDLNSHLQGMADQMGDKPWDPDLMVSLRQRLEQQVSSYVMASQRSTYDRARGQTEEPNNPLPKIELF